MMEEAIGIFDSGVGGLTVVREIMRQLPGENVIYFGDTARVPYGGKSKSTIIRFSEQNIRFLQSKKVKAIVIACNTASALALDEIKGNYDMPIIGVVEPGAKAAAKIATTKNLGIIGTSATIKSGVYNRYLRGLRPDITVVTKACPLFTPLVEEGLMEDRVTDDIANRYLSELKDYNIDSLILGCTHYPLLRNAIARCVGEDVNLINPAYETTRCLKKLLTNKNIANTSNAVADVKYYVSDATENFITVANRILPYTVDETNVTSINIEEY